MDIVLRRGAKLFPGGRRLDASGLANVPDHGPVVLAARHYHNLLDAVGLIRHVERPLHFLVALDWVSRRSTRTLMEGLTAFAGWPVTLRTDELRDRWHAPPGARPCAYRLDESFAYRRRSYNQCQQILRDGGVLVVFPEGYPVVDPHAEREPRATVLAPFKPGFAKIAVAASRTTGRPVRLIPVGIRVLEPPRGGLCFTFGHGRDVTDADNVERLTSETHDDVLRLST